MSLYPLLHLAIELAGRSPPDPGSFCVGSVIATCNDEILATGFTREFGDGWHAEHVALEKLLQSGRASEAAVMYASMEPCSVRASGRSPCCSRILRVGIPKVVFAAREPPLFVNGRGARVLSGAGIEVVEVPELAAAALAANAHLPIFRSVT